MTNPNDFAFNDSETRFKGLNKDGGKEYYQPPLTKREYFAVHATEPLPSSFCQKYIRKKEEKEGGKRMTAGNYYEILTPEERIEVRALWRVKCADALINALNQDNESTRT